MTTRSHCSSLAVLATVALLACGCLPAVHEEAVKARHPASAPTRQDERQEGESTVETAVEGDVVSVSVEKQTDCRSVTRTPMAEERGTKRTLEGGTAAQAVNLGSAALLLGGGIALYAASGSQAEKGNTSAEQIEKDKRANETLGIGVMASAAIPLGLFVWNLFRAKDEVGSFAAEPTESASPWQRCSRSPAASVPISLGYTNGAGSEETLKTATDGAGAARLDLSKIQASRDAAKLMVESPRGTKTIVLSLKGTPMRLAFEQKLKRLADAKYVDQIEADAAGIERILVTLERRKEPWGDSELEEARRMVDLFKDMRQTLSALMARKPIDASLDQRFGPLAPKVGAFGRRAEALLPRAKKAAEARDAREAAFWTAILSEGSSSSGFGGGSSDSSSNDDSRVRDMEDRHQRERKEDEDRHQRERAQDEQRRKDDKQQQHYRCNDQCDRDEASCENHCPSGTYCRCHDKKEDCRSRCYSTYGR